MHIEGAIFPVITKYVDEAKLVSNLAELIIERSLGTELANNSPATAA